LFTLSLSLSLSLDMYSTRPPSGVLAENKVGGSGFAMPKFAPAIATGAVAYAGSKFLLGTTGTSNLPGLGSVDSSIAFGATCAAAELITDATSGLISKLPVVGSTLGSWSGPVVTGAASAALVSYTNPSLANREGYLKLAVVGGASCMVGNNAAMRMGWNW
jgi:hypothetical protein